MAVTLEQIGEFLKKKEMNFDIDSERNVLTSGLSDSKNAAMLFIRVKDDGKYFQLQMEPLTKDREKMFDIPRDHPNIVKVLMQLLKNNYQMKYGNWEYDYEDGDLRFAVEIPVEDTTMTYDQIDRVISVCFTALGDVEGLHYILENGVFPQENSEDKMLADMMRALLASQKSGKSDSDDSDSI